jgi:hypothetical protein
MNLIKQQENNINYDYYEQDQRGNQVRLEEEETNRWEIETETIIEKFCRSLLGEVEDEKGSWVRDFNKERRMNEKGYSYIKNEMLRISRVLFLTELDKEEKNRMLNSLGKIIANMLTDNYSEWDVKPEISNFESLATGVLDNVEFALNSALGGGMRKHRERSKYPMQPMPQQPTGVM